MGNRHSTSGVPGREQHAAVGRRSCAAACATRCAQQWQPSPRYPDPLVQDHRSELRQVPARPREDREDRRRLPLGEGPVWFGDGRFLLWSDIPNNRIMKWDEETGAVSVFRKPSNNSNGNTRDRQGRLVTCEHDARRVTRTEYDGSITVIADKFDGKPLNSPNDLVCRSRTARSGSPIRRSASSATTKATSPSRSCRRTSIAGIRRPRKVCRGGRATSIARTAWRFRRTRRSCTSSKRRHAADDPRVRRRRGRHEAGEQARGGERRGQGLAGRAARRRRRQPVVRLGQAAKGSTASRSSTRTAS